MIHDDARALAMRRSPRRQQAVARATASPRPSAARASATPGAVVATQLSGVPAPGYLAGGSASASVVTDELRRPGQPLPAGQRADMEARLEADFSSVRLHTGITAQRSAAALGARAYTVGEQIVVGEPHLDRHTLAHELTHVLQQRAGSVAGTHWGDGLRVSDPGDRFERSAEDNAHRVLAGAAPSVIGTPAVAGTAGITVQRLFGMEKETKVPVHLQEKTIKEWPTIAEVPGILKVDVDHSDGESILEFVLKAFDEHSGSDREAHAELDRRLKVLEDLIAASIAAPGGTLLHDVVDLFDGTTLEGYAQATVNDIVPAKPDSGPVHFTVGFSLAAMPRLIQERLTKRETAKGGQATRRAVQASSLANWMLGQREVPGARDLAGFVATVYLQVAAIMDGTKARNEATMAVQAAEEAARAAKKLKGPKAAAALQAAEAAALAAVKEAKGLDKNRTNALSRVPVDVMFGNLRPEQRAWLTAQHAAIIGRMRSTYSGLPKAWGDSHKNDAKLMPPPVKALLEAAFSGVPYNPVRDFGEMTVVDRAEAVGPKDEELGDRGYAMELRREKISSDAPREERIASAHRLLQYSRRLHGSDDYSVLMATSSSLS